MIMKPFCVGDYIIVGDVEGVVQKIDVVYTTLTTADNRAVILPNGKLADSNIVNATKEDRRRVDFADSALGETGRLLDDPLGNDRAD